MKVLLTGALGNVGLYTVDALLEAGHEVVAFDLETSRTRKAASRVDGRVRLVWGDITDPAALGAALEGMEAVVHLAAHLAPEKAPDLARRVNVDATRSLIALMEATPTARRLVFAIGIGFIPTEAFVRSEVPRYFGDWVDTEESQRLLQYQKRGLDELKADTRKHLGVIAALIRLLRPFATWALLRSSPYLKANRR